MVNEAQCLLIRAGIDHMLVLNMILCANSIMRHAGFHTHALASVCLASACKHPVVCSHHPTCVTMGASTCSYEP